MTNQKHIVIYSHGNGVRKDDVGLLTDIADSLPEVENILFDYYEIDEINKTLTTCPISEQVEKLNKVIKEVKDQNPDAIIDLIAHSQGTVVAALANIEGIRKCILLTPVFDMSIERTLKRYSTRDDCLIDLNGMSTLYRFDGYLRYVPKEYWTDRENIKTFEAYNKLVEKTEVVIVEANQDTILPKVDLGELSSKIKLVTIDGDHNFNGKDRELLLKTVRKFILD